MGFQDVFKNSFIARFTSEDITVLQIVGVLLLVALISIYIFVIYRLVTRKTFYSKNFNISIAALAMITAAIILAVQSNIVISLGMVGALSIVRFRTAVKDPMDLCFLFWAIAVGICCGAHMAEIAIILSVSQCLSSGLFGSLTMCNGTSSIKSYPAVAIKSDCPASISLIFLILNQCSPSDK